jgi:hypothetical protein
MVVKQLDEGVSVAELVAVLLVKPKVRGSKVRGSNLHMDRKNSLSTEFKCKIAECSTLIQNMSL